MFGIEYSQYIKGEVDFIKHWDFGKKNTLAMRAFIGLAVPYGNAQSIPFSRSYFREVLTTTEVGKRIVLDPEEVEEQMILTRPILN